MPKTATVHAQQMWEYLSVTHKTDAYLINELNELGKEGWELVNATYNKDVKGVAASFSWTAILKRPLVSGAATAPRPKGSPAAREPDPPPSTLDSDPESAIFDMRNS